MHWNLRRSGGNPFGTVQTESACPRLDTSSPGRSARRQSEEGVLVASPPKLARFSPRSLMQPSLGALVFEVLKDECPEMTLSPS